MLVSRAPYFLPRSEHRSHRFASDWHHPWLGSAVASLSNSRSIPASGEGLDRARGFRLCHAYYLILARRRQLPVLRLFPVLRLS